MGGNRLDSPPPKAADLDLEARASYEKSSEVGGEVEAVERSPLRKSDSVEDEVEESKAEWDILVGE